MKFVANAPALQLGAILVVADLHLGIEYEFRKRGAAIGPQHLSAAAELNNLKKKTGAKHLVVLGDLKHDVAGMDEQEEEMLREFFAALEFKQTIVCKGNHDSGIERLEGDSIRLVGPEGFVLDAENTRFGLCHGHAWPSEQLFQSRCLITAHNHPQIEFTDSLGSRASLPAWIIGELHESEDPTIQARGVREGQQCIVMPAFGKLCGGSSFNRVPSSQLLGPLFTNSLFDVENARAHSLQGTDLGRISSLRGHARL